MSSRVVLIILQALGGISLLPYPFVLLANVMSMAGEGPRGMQRLLLVAGFGLLSLYPLAWIGLWVMSWRALGRGANGLAFGLSAVPVAVTLAAAGFLMSNSGPSVR